MKISNNESKRFLNVSFFCYLSPLPKDRKRKETVTPYGRKDFKEDYCRDLLPPLLGLFKAFTLN